MARWYCLMCEKLFKKSGDCPICGYPLEKWPGGGWPREDDGD